MNITDFSFSRTISLNNDYFMRPDWNYLIVKLGNKIDFIRYKSAQLNNQFELKNMNFTCE